MQVEALLGGVGAAVFLGAAYSFFSVSSALMEGRARDLMFLEGLFSLSVSIFSAFFLALGHGGDSVIFFDLSFLSIFAFWSFIAYLFLAFSRSFGFKNTAYLRRLMLERNVSEFFGRHGYVVKVPARHLLDARLITPHGTLSEGVTLEQMEAEGHVCRISGHVARGKGYKKSGAGTRKKPASGRRRRS